MTNTENEMKNSGVTLVAICCLCFVGCASMRTTTPQQTLPPAPAWKPADVQPALVPIPELPREYPSKQVARIYTLEWKP